MRGGAELHCRLIGELLSGRHEVEVVTTCARDYVTWANELPRGIEAVNGVPVWRFPVARPRDPQHFGRLQERIFHRPHTDAEAHAWLDAQGPYTPAMRDWIERYRDRFDYWICFSYRYWTTYHAMQAAAGRAVLVPTAEPDPAIDVPLFWPLFRGARAIVYNSHEERDMILARSGAHDVPGEVVGVGIQEPGAAGSIGQAAGRIDQVPGGTDQAIGGVNAQRFRDEFGINGPFMLYVGRIDENKGCRQLFDFHARTVRRCAERGEQPPLLVLAGHAVLEIPDHPTVRHAGAVSEQQKWDALAACDFLVMPSFYESLSMVLLEAWAVSRPVLVNAHCAVLRGQVERSNGGLWYGNGEEFVEAALLLSADARLRDTCGRAGQRYFAGNYRWPVIARKYEAILQRLEEGAPAVSNTLGTQPTGSSAP
jgi:glycosyltransferase involved in cell wall biosynthesis